MRNLKSIKRIWGRRRKNTEKNGGGVSRRRRKRNMEKQHKLKILNGMSYKSQYISTIDMNKDYQTRFFLKASMYYLKWMFLKYKNKVWKMINCDKMWVAAHSIHKYMKYWEENASLQRAHRRWCHLNNVQKDIKPSNILGIHIW